MRQSPPRLIPVLLLQRNGLYKTRKFKEPRYVGDPINAVRIFNEKEVDELVFLDIEASKVSSGPSFDAIGALACECFMPLCYGGGVSSLRDIERILRLGVEKVAINTAIHRNPGFVAEAVKEFGGSTVVASIDYRRTFTGRAVVYVRGGTQNTKRALDDYILSAESLGVGEILLNSIDCDGSQTGYDLATVSRVTGNLSVPLVACGGASSLLDMRRVVEEGGANAAAAGSLFVFIGRHRAVLINYPSQDEILKVFSLSKDERG